MRFLFGANAAEAARQRWEELLADENVSAGVIAGAITAATFAPMLALAANWSVIVWSATFPLAALGIGIGVRRASRAVTSRFGAVAGVSAALSGVASLTIAACGSYWNKGDFASIPTQCAPLMAGNPAVVAATFAVAVLVAFSAGFRQVSVAELLAGKRCQK